MASEEEELFEVTCSNEGDEQSEIVFECSLCDMSFSDVNEHLKQYHEDCKLQSASDETTTVEEVINDGDKAEVFDGTAFVIKNSDGKFECKECFRTYLSVKRFIAHVKTHSSVTEEIIQTLEERIKELEESEDVFDIIDDKGSGKKSFRCKICNTIFKTKKQLLLHCPIHRNVAEAKKKHALMENAVDSFYCQLCNRSLNNADELEMHMNAHEENKAHGSKVASGSSEPPKKRKKGESSYPCQYCQKDFKRPHEKVKHERIHTGEKPYSCDICGKKFRVTYCLSLHKRNVHSDERPYVCIFEGCNKRFKSQSVYNHHLNTHGTEKNYKCPFCSKAFKTSVQLAGHRNTHTKPFLCQVCSRAFASLYAAKIHMEVHRTLDDNLKYTCKICSAQYGRSFALSDHMKIAHAGANDPVDNEGGANEDDDEHYIIEESQLEIIEGCGEVYTVEMLPDGDEN